MVCKKAVRSQQGIAQLKRCSQRPHVDDQVGEALPELQALADGEKDRVVPAQEYLKETCRPSLVLG